MRYALQAILTQKYRRPLMVVEGDATINGINHRGVFMMYLDGTIVYLAPDLETAYNKATKKEKDQDHAFTQNSHE